MCSAGIEFSFNVAEWILLPSSDCQRNTAVVLDNTCGVLCATLLTAFAFTHTPQSSSLCQGWCQTSLSVLSLSRLHPLLPSVTRCLLKFDCAILSPTFKRPLKFRLHTSVALLSVGACAYIWLHGTIQIFQYYFFLICRTLAQSCKL